MLVFLGKFVGWLGFLISLFESPFILNLFAKAKDLLLSVRDGIQALVASKIVDVLRPAAAIA